MAGPKSGRRDDFDPLDPPGQPAVRVHFAGALFGKAVIWKATVMTLKHASALRPFIEVGEEEADGRALRVALPLEVIDLPAIRKAVVMIRQWKGLAPGRHEFGARAGKTGKI